jgi:hypothetical protein
VVLTLCNEGGLASPLHHPNYILLHFASEILNRNFLFELRETVTCSEFFSGCFCRGCVMSKGMFLATELVCMQS